MATSLVGNNLDRFIKFGRRTPVIKTTIDTITDPSTYRGFANQVDDVLQRALPGQFRGVGIQNAPVGVLGQVDDISRMAPGAAKEAARNQVQRNLNAAARLDDVALPRGGQAASGALRAPNVPSSPRSFDLNYPRGARAVPKQVIPGGLYNVQGPAIPGGVQTMANMSKGGGGFLKGAKNVLKAGPLLNVAGGALDAYDQVQEGADPIDAIGRATFGVLGGIGGTTAGTLGGLITGPGALLTGTAGAYGGYNLGTGLYDMLKENIQNPGDANMSRLGPMPKLAGARKAEFKSNENAAPSASDMMSGRRAPKPKPNPKDVDDRPDQGADLDMDAIRRKVAEEYARGSRIFEALKPSVETPVPGAPPNAPNVIPGTPIPVTPGSPARPYAPGDQAGNMGATYGNGTSTMPNANPANTVLPPNAEQILQADPMQIYEQARRAAQGQDKTQLDKVRDLGLAIHKQTFPNLYSSDNSLPGSMTAKDENDALREIEPSQIDQSLLGIYSGSNPVLDPNKFLQMQLSGRVAR